MNAEVIVVGSGPSAVHLAQTLIEKGHQVLMLDVGATSENNPTISNDNFTQLRKTDPQQFQYFLGKNLEAATWGRTGVGAQLSAARRYMIEHVDELTPKNSDTFTPYESLAKGGLGVGWGAGCYQFSAAELRRCGLDENEMLSAYQIVANRIGISQPGQDVLPYTSGGLNDLEPQLKISPTFQNILAKYELNKLKFAKRNFHVGIPALAILGRDRGMRKAHAYNEMEFYHDNDQSVYRPWMTLEELKRHPQFSYRPDILVTKYSEASDFVQIDGFDNKTKEKFEFRARYLALAAGTLGTSRIVLRSTAAKGVLPILCNMYSYFPTLKFSSLGEEMPDKGLALAQLAMFHQNEFDEADIAMASMYNYKSLMLFRLLKESPFGFSYSRKLFQFLQSGLIIFGIHHPDRGEVGKRSLQLESSSISPTFDRLNIEFEPESNTLDYVARREKQFCWAMRRLGCLPIKKINPGYGSSIHYGGTLPFSETEKDFHLHSSGRIHNCKRTFVADGSGLNFLPAKGVTFTLMAMGHLTGTKMSQYIKSESST